MSFSIIFRCRQRNRAWFRPISRLERNEFGDLPARLPVEVSFRDGLLAIRSNKATLSEVLFAVQRTGAEIAIPAGAEQEKSWPTLAVLRRRKF